MNTIAYGTAVGWTSAAFLVLESNESPLEKGALLLSEIAWVASIFGVGGSVGTLVVGWTCQKYGRRPSLLASGIPMVASWFLIMYAKNAWYLYLSRFMSGFAGAASFVAIPFLVAEVSEDKIRGALGSIVTLAANSGILIGFLVGNYFSYENVPKILLIVPILFLAFYYFFPESPYYLVTQNRYQEAESSLRFYRNMLSNTEKKLEEVFQSEFQRLKMAHEEQVFEQKGKPSITLSDFGKFIFAYKLELNSSV